KVEIRAAASAHLSWANIAARSGCDAAAPGEFPANATDCAAAEAADGELLRAACCRAALTELAVGAGATATDGAAGTA
ncbi:hypothetical protein, partial [Hymenobacter agri]